MINLLNYRDQEEVIRIIAQCSFPDQARILSEYQRYSQDPSRLLLGKIKNDELLGLVGLIRLTEQEMELKHIAVQPSHRNQGVGREMIEQLRNDLLVPQMANEQDEMLVHEIVAETDKDAVGFYIKMGFEVTSLGEKYAGVERFRCILC